MPPKARHRWYWLGAVVGVLVVFGTLLMSCTPTTSGPSLNPEQITTTIHSTHAYVNLAPEFCCGGTIFGGCGRQYDAWTLSTYRSLDGEKHTFHQTQSVDNDLEHRNLTRHVSIPFKGTAVYLYMAPRRFLRYPPGDQEICINGVCQSVNVIARYKAAGDSDEPVLMWWAENLDQDHGTLLELRLVDRNWGGRTGSMSFQYLKYTQNARNRTQPSLSEGLRLINTTLHDTHYTMGYTPATSHSECCGDYKPWDKRLFESSSRASDTFHHTSNRGNEPFGDQIRQVSFSFRGAAIYLYGPPPQALKEIWGDEFVHGRQEVCINNRCQGLDVHQTYLNVGFFQRNDPVLLWSFKFFSPKPHSHSTSDSFSLDHPMKFRLRLLDPDSPVRVSQMALDHAIISEIHTIPHWHHPLSNGRYNSSTIGFGSVKYTPDPTAWTGVAVGTSNVAMQAFDVLSEDVMPGWRHEFTGHDIKVFGAPRIHMENIEHATQMICADAECHYVDVEQVYLAIDTWDYWKPVMLLRLSDLDPYTKHTISAIAVRKNRDSAKPRVMTFQSLEYETFTPVIPTLTPVIPTSTPPITTSTSAIPQPTLPSPEHPLPPTIPSPEHPLPGNGGIRSTIILAIIGIPLAFLAAAGFAYVLRLALGNGARFHRSRREDTEPLLQDHAPWCPAAPPPRPAYHAPPAPPFPASAQLPTYLRIPGSYHPYAVTSDDDDWVARTPETTSAAPLPAAPTRHLEEPTVAPLPSKNWLGRVLSVIRGQQTTQAMASQGQRPDPPSASPNPPPQAAPMRHDAWSHLASIAASQQHLSRGAAAPTGAAVPAYGATGQHFPR